MSEITNYMEIRVKECMEVLLEATDGCKCNKCQRDIFTLALNNLKPYYSSTERGKVMVKLESTEQQVETDIVVQVTKAIKIVHNNPRHDN